MKKLFVFLLAVMAVMSVSAQTKLTLGGQSANGNWSWGTTKTMGAAVALHFGSQWGEFTLASAPGEATGCKLVVAEPNAKVNLVVKHADGNNEYIAVDAAEKNVTFASAATLVELQATEAAQDLEVQSFVLIGADGTETQTSYAENWGVSTYGGVYTSTSQWAQVMLNGAEQADPQIIKFHCNAPVPAGLQLKVLNEDGTDSYLQLTEGETEPAIEIEKAVKEVSLQFTATDLTIDIAYVTTEPVPAPAIVPCTNTAVSFGSKEDARFAQQTQMSGVANAVLTCEDDDVVTVASTKGKYWSHAIVGDWTNEAAVNEMNEKVGTQFTAADFAANSGITISMAGAQGNNSTLTVDLPNHEVGKAVTLYTTVSFLETKAPLDNITVAGLDDAKVAYAVGNGDGFVAEPTFCPTACGLTLVKVTGRLTDAKQVVISSASQFVDTTIEDESANTFTPKVGYQVVAYNIADYVPTVSDVTFDFTSAESIEALGFTAPEAGAGTEIGTTPIVSGGVTITPTAEGTTPTRFWQSTGKNGGYDLRVYTDAVLTFSAPEGKVITSIVCEDNNKWSEPTPSTGAFDGKTWTGSANSVDWTFNGQCRFKTITVTYGDAKTYTLDFYVEGADEMCDEWAVQVGDQKLEYPYDNDEPYTFAEGSKVYVGGICLDQIHTMVVTVNGEELENEGEYGANLFTFDLTQNTVIKIAFKQNYTLNFSADYDEMCDEWGVYADGQKLEYPYDNDNPYTFVEGTQISVGGICIDALHEMVVTVNDEVVPADAFDPDTRVYTFTLSQDTNIKIQFKDPAVAVATYAQTEDSAEPAVAVQFLDHTTCFFDKYKYNNVDVTLVDANGTSYDIVRTEDNYQLADYSCDVTSFILGAELPAGNYTLTIPAGAMVVDDASNSYTFNANDYVIDFTVTDAAPAKLINKGNVNAINNVNVADDNAPVYNIAGQRVSNAQKGIFIQNGKKFINK